MKKILFAIVLMFCTFNLSATECTDTTFRINFSKGFHEMNKSLPSSIAIVKMKADKESWCELHYHSNTCTVIICYHQVGSIGFAGVQKTLTNVSLSFDETSNSFELINLKNNKKVISYDNKNDILKVYYDFYYLDIFETD